MAVFVYRPEHPLASAFGMVDAALLDTQDLRRVDGDARVPVFTDRYMEGVRAVDGTDIGSRGKRRDYMKARGLADAGDFTQHWVNTEKERAALFSGTSEKHDREVKAAVVEAFHRLSRP